MDLPNVETKYLAIMQIFVPVTRIIKINIYV